MKIILSLDGLLITNPTNIRYLTGFVGAGGNEREVYLLITKNQDFLITYGLYLEQAKNLEPSNCFVTKIMTLLAAS